MIVCPSCGHKNEEGTTECTSCGASLDDSAYRLCRICGALNPATHAYCRRCYSLLDISQVAPEVQATLTAGSADAAEATPSGGGPTAGERQEENVDDALSGGPEQSDVMATALQEGEEDRLFRQPGVRDGEGGPSAAIDPGLDPEGAIPLAASVMQPDLSSRSAARGPSDAERHTAELFRQTVTEHAPLAEPAHLVVPTQVRRVGRLGRLMISLLVLAAALIPFVGGGYTAEWVSPRASVQALYATVESLPSNEPVLISFDYGGTYSAELDPLVMTVMEHLARRSVPMLLMSTSPSGLGMADRTMDALAGSPNVPEMTYGVDYALLGFVPGEEAGLRTLTGGLARAFPTDIEEGQALAEMPIGEDVEGLGDIRHVFVLADDQVTVRQWVEQVQGRTGVHLHALVTTRVEPMLVPYRESAQLTSLLAAASGAAEYEVLSGIEGKGLLYSDGVVALAIVVLGLAVAANVGSRRASRPGEDDD